METMKAIATGINLGQEWRDVKGYEGLYKVSDTGAIANAKTLQILKPWINDKHGYTRVALCKNGVQERFLVHRIVAEAFIPNPQGLPQINHKDENPGNNRVDNLEWCDAKYNNNYGSHTKKIVVARSMPVVATRFRKKRVFLSVNEAARQLNLNRGNLSKACKACKKHKGWSWHYMTPEEAAIMLDQDSYAIITSQPTKAELNEAMKALKENLYNETRKDV